MRHRTLFPSCPLPSFHAAAWKVMERHFGCRHVFSSGWLRRVQECPLGHTWLVPVYSGETGRQVGSKVREYFRFSGARGTLPRYSGARRGCRAAGRGLLDTDAPPPERAAPRIRGRFHAIVAASRLLFSLQESLRRIRRCGFSPPSVAPFDCPRGNRHAWREAQLQGSPSIGCPAHLAISSAPRAAPLVLAIHLAVAALQVVHPLASGCMHLGQWPRARSSVKARRRPWRFRHVPWKLDISRYHLQSHSPANLKNTALT